MFLVFISLLFYLVIIVAIAIPSVVVGIVIIIIIVIIIGFIMKKKSKCVNTSAQLMYLFIVFTNKKLRNFDKIDKKELTSPDSALQSVSCYMILQLKKLFVVYIN